MFVRQLARLYRQTKSKILNVTMAAILLASSAGGALPSLLSEVAAAPQTISTVTVSGDTAAGENQPGWLFNRDPANATPIEFNTDAASIGTGSLYVLPLSSTPAHKFIGEFFALTEIDSINSVSYDFKIGGSGTAADANEFYMNVYANFGTSSPTKFYDCNYSVVPTSGSTSDFTTVTFDPAQNYPVKTHDSSPFPCPESPAAMNLSAVNSTIRAFAINLGDTMASDQGIGGYFDNFIFNTTDAVTTYDFEPDTTAPSVPTNGWPHSTTLNSNVFNYTWDASTDISTPITYEYQAATHPTFDSNGDINGTVSGVYWRNWIEGAGNPSQYPLTSPLIPSVGTSDGHWYWQVRAIDSKGNKSAWSEVWDYTLDSTSDTTKPAVTLVEPLTNSYNPSQIVVNATDETSLYRVTAHIYDQTNTTLLQPCSELADGATNFTLTCGVPSLPDGVYTIRANAQDNASPMHTSFTIIRQFTVDTTRPTVSVTTPLDNAVTTGTFTIKGTASDASGIEKVLITIGRRNASNVFAGYVIQNVEALWDGTNFSYHVSGLPEFDGTYYIRALAIDYAGNSRSGGSDGITVDTSAPVIEISNVVVGTDKKLSFDLKAMDDGSGLLHVAANIYDESNTNKVISLGKKADGQPGSLADTTRLNEPFSGLPFGTSEQTYNLTDIDVSGLPSGTYTIRAFARDHLDNATVSFVLHQFTVDNTVPFVEITGYGQSGNQIQPNVTATDPSTPLVYAWSSNPSNPGTAAFDDDVLNPVFTVTTEGTYAFELTVTDAAGNSTTVPFTFTYTEPEEDTEPAFSNVATANDSDPNAPLNDDGAGPNDPEQQQQQVLSTTSTQDETGGNTELVENAASTNTGKFLGLGWWWLAILGALVILWLLFGARRSEDKN